MRCDDCREALSARMDGEDLPPGLAAAAVDVHIAGCGACQAWEASAVRLTRALRVEAAEPMPDLWPAVRDASAAAVTSPTRLAEAAVTTGRWLLAAVALGQLVVAIPGMVLGHGDGLTNHLAREVGGVDVALAVGFLYAALRPRRVAGMVPLVAALVACHLAAAAVDVAMGRTGASQESAHALEVVGLGLLWVVSHGIRGRGVLRRGPGQRTRAA
jgi:predicted anti-sigma-YlaC factor YlaD